MLDAGWRPAEQDVERIASEVLALLVYLQQQQVTAINLVESVSLHCHHLLFCYMHVLQKFHTSLLFGSICLPSSHVACHTICLLCNWKLE